MNLRPLICFISYLSKGAYTQYIKMLTVNEMHNHESLLALSFCYGFSFLKFTIGYANKSGNKKQLTNIRDCNSKHAPNIKFIMIFFSSGSDTFNRSNLLNELWEWDSKINALLLQKLLKQTNDYKVRLETKN